MLLRYSWLVMLCLNLFSLPSYSVENSISAGTTIKVKMAEPIDSRVRKAGYRFNVTIEGDIKIAQKVIIKSGSKAQAIINKIQKSGRGKAPPEIIVTLSAVQVNNRQVNIQTFLIAGKGTTTQRKVLGTVDKNENIVMGQNREKITTSIPLRTEGYNITLAEGTTLYFILKEPLFF
ncbi:hypothetical protein [Psychromonas hadalis]|uniref:hypothetical protein n=1 Tax=Psychromonas hadalis TaxID=211669 RepID=UPI000413C778|nr:hypothetical protein [Psychromonas hadalis]